MDRKHRLGFSWLAIVLCMALLMTGMPFAPAYAKSKKKESAKETTFTIKWKVNGETIKKDKVKKGEKPEKPADPADYTDGKYTYTFSGWDPKVTKATQDMTYQAKFKKSERTFRITWLDDKGKKIDVTEVKYGKVPDHEAPKKEASEKYTYTFDGWDPKPVKAKADATYTATYKKEARRYVITWLDDKGNVIDQTKVAYGKLPAHDDPVKKSGKATYTFTGWKPELAKVTGDATYTATFRKEEKYTITWLDDAGNVIDTTQVEKGQKPTHDDPVKEATEQYTYTFAGWTPKVVRAQADATYTATFKEKARKYTITWLDADGNEIDRTQVAYGKKPTHADPTREETESFTYVFKGWEPKPARVTGDATYRAVFEEVPKKVEPTEAPGDYTITWLDDAGNVIDTTRVSKGQKPTHDAPVKEPTEQYTYKFAGWTPKVVRAKADATYTATFKEKLRKYTITWQDDEGNVIDETRVAYGKTPKHDDPVKAPSENATYTFAGWTPELAPVTGDAIYTATFTQTLNGETDPGVEDPSMAAGNSVEILFKYLGDTPDKDTLIDYPQKVVETDEPQQVYYSGTEPEKAEDDNFAYEWIGWTDDRDNPTVAKYGKSTDEKETPLLPVVTVETPAETVYYAVFRAIPKHTITWNNDDGTPIDTTRVAEGRRPVHEDPARKGYKFDGWLDEKMTLYAAGEELPEVTGDAIYTAQYTVDKVLYDITWVIDGAVEVTKVAAGERPTHEDPVSAVDGYVFAGWEDAKGKLRQADKLPVVTAAAIYTAQWELALTLPDVNCYALLKSKADRKTAKETLLPTEVTLEDGTVVKGLDWSDAELDGYVPSNNGVKNDGKYTYTLLHPQEDDENRILKLTCTLIVGPKQSKTAGKGKNKKANEDYTYRWDSIVADAAKARAIIITGWSGDDKALVIPSVIDGMAVTAIGNGVFQNKKKVTSITVPAGVTDIGKGAFANCENLTTLTLPDSLTSIGMELTDGSDALTTLNLSVVLETTLAMDQDGYYTIRHVADKTDPENPVMSQTVTLPEGFPTDIAIAAPGELTLADDFVVTKGHQVADASLVTEDGGTLKAEIIWLDDDETEIDRTEVAYGEIPTHDAPEGKTGTDGIAYAFKGWTPTPVEVTGPATYTAEYGEEQYTVTFMDDDTELEKAKFNANETPRYSGKTPTREEDERYTYTFDGWVDAADKKEEPTVYPDDKLPKVTADVTYKAHFATEERMYTVTFVNYDYDGKTDPLEEAEFRYSEIPKYSGETPTREAEEQYTYTFDGWVDAADKKEEPTVYPDDELPEVTADVTYKAHFTPADRMYTVTFVNHDGKTVLETAEFRYSAIPKYRGEGTPTREADERYTYTFEGWVDAADEQEEPTVYIEGENDLPPVTADVTYKAHYISADRLYTLTFVNEDGTTELLKKEGYKYEDQPIYDGEVPTKAADEQHYFAFEGWVDVNDASKKPTVYASDKLPKVTADATYKATFKEGTPVALVATYTGKGLTKEYDCNKYGAYMKDGQVVYVIEDLKTIKSQFKLAPSGKKAKWVADHKNVDFKLALSKQYDSADVGSYEFEFRVTLTGDDAMYYKMKEEMVKVPASITPREVVVTPRAGLYKTYGTTDPKYPEGSWLSNDETSPLHQDLSGVAGYGVPVNTVDGKLSLSITNAAYLLQEANLKGTKFFPGDNPWLVRQEGEDVGKYKILIGGMNFGSNFTVKLKDEVFTINAKDIGDANVTVDAIASQQYTGKAITLDKDKLVVRYGTMTLEEGKDFTTEYKNNIEASTDTQKATVTLKGKKDSNYTGTKEVTFSIIKTVTPTATPKTSGGGSSGGYSGGSSSYDFGYDDFDDDPEGDTAGEEEEAEAQSNANWTPVPGGNIKLNEMDYGTVLFGADGKPRPFTQLEEDYEGDIADSGDAQTEFEDIDDAEDGAVEVEDTDEEPPMLHRVVIRADSMKRRVDTTELDEAEEGAEDQVEEDVLLEGTDRKRYEELHLRLTDSIVQGLINNGISEIVYELEQTKLRIPLSALSSVITLPDDEESPDDGFDVEDELEIEDGGEAEEDGEIVVDDADVSSNSPSGTRTLPVDGYEIVIEQADATGLTPREAQLIADNTTLLPAYRVRVRIIPEDAQQAPTGEVDENGLPITVPVTEPLPEGYTLPGVVLLLQTNDSFEMSPEEAQVLYASEEFSTAEGGAAFVENVVADEEAVEVTEENAGDEAEQVNSLKENAQAIAEDASEFEANAEDETEDSDGFEADAEDDSEEEEDIGEAMVANNHSLADAIDSEKASLTQAIFNEEEIPMVVEIDPVESGLYVVLVPQDWDPTPYLSQEDGEETTTDEADEDEVEFVDESEIDDEELVEF